MFKQVNETKMGGEVVLNRVVIYFKERLREHFRCRDLQLLVGRISAVDVSKS